MFGLILSILFLYFFFHFFPINIFCECYAQDVLQEIEALEKRLEIYCKNFNHAYHKVYGHPCDIDYKRLNKDLIEISSKVCDIEAKATTCDQLMEVYELQKKKNILHGKIEDLCVDCWIKGPYLDI